MTTRFNEATEIAEPTKTPTQLVAERDGLKRRRNLSFTAVLLSPGAVAHATIRPIVIQLLKHAPNPSIANPTGALVADGLGFALGGILAFKLGQRFTKNIKALDSAAYVKAKQAISFTDPRELSYLQTKAKFGLLTPAVRFIGRRFDRLFNTPR